MRYKQSPDISNMNASTQRGMDSAQLEGRDAPSVNDQKMIEIECSVKAFSRLCTANRPSRRKDRHNHRSSLCRSMRSIDAKIRRTLLRETQNQDAEDRSSSVTLSTKSSSSTSDESSCFNAEECKSLEESSPIQLEDAPRLTSTRDYEDDGYGTDDTDQAVCDISDKSTVPKTRALPKRQPNTDPTAAEHSEVEQIVDQLMKEQTIALEAWNDVATEYHRRIEPFTSMFVPHLLDSKHLMPSAPSSVNIGNIGGYRYNISGKSVLDVAAGTGAGALHAASKGASYVMATDFSEKMMDVLQDRIDASHYKNFHTKVCNGMCLPLKWKNAFDISISNFGVIYFPKVKAGLSEMVRCTKPGGKVCLSGWGSREETPAFRIFPKALKMCGLDRAWYQAQSASRKEILSYFGIEPTSSVSSSSSNGDDKTCEQQGLHHHQGERKSRRKKKRYEGISITPNYFCPTLRAITSQFYLRSIMDEAGLDDIKVIPVTKDLRLDSVECYWDRFVLASPTLKRIVGQCLSDDEVLQLKDAVTDILTRQHCVDQQVVLQATAYIAIGTKPRKHRSRKERE